MLAEIAADRALHLPQSGQEQDDAADLDQQGAARQLHNSARLLLRSAAGIAAVALQKTPRLPGEKEIDDAAGARTGPAERALLAVAMPFAVEDRIRHSPETISEEAGQDDHQQCALAAKILERPC